jgi:hypothetical protein
MPVAAGIALVLCALLASCRPASSAKPVLESEGPVWFAFSTNNVRVGDVFEFRLSAIHPATAQVRPPSLNRPKEILVRDQRADTEPLPDGKARTTFLYSLTSFVVGEHRVSSNAVQFVSADGSLLEEPFPDARFTVESVLTGKDTPPRDIKGPARWKRTTPPWITGLLIVAALAVVAALLARRFLGKPRTILRYPPPPPPHEVALRALQELISKGWIEAENVEPFYVGLSQIVRSYIEDRFGLRAPERTTEEFIREASTSRSLPPAHQTLTRDFLEQSDLVKFARHRPAQADMRAAHGAAERLVKETRPVPPPEVAAP